MDRSLVRFQAGIRSEATRKTYESDLKRFLSFVKIKDASGLMQLKDAYLNELVEDYTIFLKRKGLRYNSVNCAISAIGTFMFMNDKVLNLAKIRKMMPERLQPQGVGVWTTEDILKMLSATTSLRNRAIIMLLASSGCRKGAVIGLKLRHVSDMPDGCKSVKFYDGSLEEYISFLTKEAADCLTAYLQKRINDGEHLSPESPLFRNNYAIGIGKAKPLTYAGLKGMMGFIIKKIRGVGDGKRQSVASFHGFRRRYNTILKNSPLGNVALKEKLMGHKGVYVLDGTYHKPNADILFQEFRLHIGELSIDGTERERLKLVEAEKKLGEMEEKDNVIAKQQADIQMLKDSVLGIYELLK